MIYIGFIATVILMLGITGAALLIFLNTSGKWNIGGVENSFKTKVFSYVLMGVVGALWGLLFNYAPFSITLN